MSANPSNGNGPRPVFWAAVLVRLSVRFLPAGAIRDRYRREFLADLHGITRREQVSYSAGVLLHAIPLRVAVRTGYRRSLTKGSDMVIRRSRPLLCLLNIHHHWQAESTSDGSRYLRCTRCGKDGTGRLDTSSGDIAAMGAAIGGGGS